MKKKEKSILFVGNTAWSMYNFRREIFESFKQQGCEVCVCAPYDEVFSKKIQDLGCKFYPVKLSAKGVNPIEDLLLIIRFLLLFLRLKPAFAFFYTIKPNIYGSIAAFFAGVPAIAITTGLGYAFLNKNLVAWVSRRLYKFAFIFPQEVWFLNQDDLDTFLQARLVSPKKAKLLKSEGINLEQFKTADLKNPPTTVPASFLLSARMLWDKGVGEFVAAAEILKKKYPDVRFALLGFTGINNPSAISEDQLQQWVQQDTVEYLGVTNDVCSVIRQFDCIVLPSYYREGIPRSLMEGAAMEKILVTTDSVGCRDTVDDKISGFLCQVKDVASLADCMEKVINMSSGERKKMGEAGRKKMEREFDIKYIIQRYSEVLKYYTDLKCKIVHPRIQNNKSILTTINNFFDQAVFFCTKHTASCLIGLLFLSLILKLAEHFLDPALGRDASYYCHMAQDWYENGAINKFSWTPPLLTFLMKSGAEAGISIQTTGLALNIIAGVLCTLAGYKIALEITDSKKIALISAAFCAVHPGINTISIQIGRDAIYLCLAGFTIWTALAGLKRKSWLFWSFSGVFCALSATARFETFEFFPLAACLLLVAAISKKLLWKQALLYGFCFYMFTAVSFYGAIRGMKAEEMFSLYQKYFDGKFNKAKQQYSNPQKGEPK